MNSTIHAHDLVLLVPDADLENTLSGLLNRHASLKTRPIRHLIRRHQGRDPGCRTLGVDFLRMYSSTVSHAVLIFDLHGSGGESVGATLLETDLEARLSANGWQDRAAVIVIDPELENWVWSQSPHVDRVVGWTGRIPSLRDWLVSESLAVDARSKPIDPKEAFHRALRTAQKRPSPALYRELAGRVSFDQCSDRAFVKLVDRLRTWFPVT